MQAVEAVMCQRCCIRTWGNHFKVLYFPQSEIRRMRRRRRRRRR